MAKTRSLVIGALLLLMCSGVARAQDVTGDWQGTLSVGQVQQQYTNIPVPILAIYALPHDPGPGDRRDESANGARRCEGGGASKGV